MKFGTVSIFIVAISVILALGPMAGMFSFPIQTVYVLALLGIGLGLAGVIQGHGKQRVLAIVAILIALLFGSYIFVIYNFVPHLG